MESIKLGVEVKDRVTGFKGIAIGKTTFLQGCNRILVQPKIKEEGVILDAISFDEPDLKVVGKGILPKPKPEPKETGGPRPMALRASEPTRKD